MSNLYHGLQFWESKGNGSHVIETNSRRVRRKSMGSTKKDQAIALRTSVVAVCLYEWGTVQCIHHLTDLTGNRPLLSGDQFIVLRFTGQPTKKTHHKGGPIAYARRISPAGFRQVFFNYHANWVGMAPAIEYYRCILSFHLLPSIKWSCSGEFIASPIAYRLVVPLLNMLEAELLGKPFNHYWSGAGSYSCGDDCYCWLALVWCGNLCG